MAQVKARELVKSYKVGEVPHPIRVVVGFFRSGHLPLEELTGDMQTNGQRADGFFDRLNRIVHDFSCELRDSKSFMTAELGKKGVKIFLETTLHLKYLIFEVENSPISDLEKELIR